MINKIRCRCGTILPVGLAHQGDVLKCSTCGCRLRIPPAKEPINASSGSTVTCTCGRTVRLPAGNSSKAFRCPHCKCIISPPTMRSTFAESGPPPNPPLQVSSSIPVPAPLQNGFEDIPIPITPRSIPNGLQQFPNPASVQTVSFTPQKVKGSGRRAQRYCQCCRSS